MAGEFRIPFRLGARFSLEPPTQYSHVRRPNYTRVQYAQVATPELHPSVRITARGHPELHRPPSTHISLGAALHLTQSPSRIAATYEATCQWSAPPVAPNGPITHTRGMFEDASIVLPENQHDASRRRNRAFAVLALHASRRVPAQDRTQTRDICAHPRPRSPAPRATKAPSNLPKNVVGSTGKPSVLSALIPRSPRLS